MKTQLNISLTTKTYPEIISGCFALLAYGLLFLLFIFLPSVVMPELMHPTQTGKFFVFAYGLMAVIVLFLLHRLFSPRTIKLRVSLLDILLGILFLYISINRYLLQEIWGFSLRYYELIGLAFLYVLLRQMDRKISPWLIMTVILSGIIQAVYGNLQLYDVYPSHHSGFKMTGSFFNPGPYAGFLAAVFPLALGMYLFRNELLHWLEKAADRKLQSQAFWHLARIILEYLPLLGVLSILLVLPSSQSRAAWLAVIMSSGYLLALKYHLISKIKSTLDSTGRKVSAALLLIMLTAGIGYGLYTYKQGSADGRLLIWKVTAGMVQDSPWIGKGFDRFKAKYMNYQADYFKGNPESAEAMVADNVYYAFNEPLQFVAENGFLGLMIFILFWGVVFSTNRKKNGDLINIAKAGLLAVIVFSLFSYPTQILPVKVIVVLLLAAIAAYQNSSEIVLQEKSLTTTFRSIFLLAAAIPSLFYIYEGTEKLHQGFQDWQSAFSIYQMGGHSQSLKEYEAVYPVFKKEGDFLMNYGKALSMAGKHKKAIEVMHEAELYLNTTIIQTALGDSYKALKENDEAEEAYLQGWDMVPARFYPKYLLAKLFDETGQEEKAMKIANELLKKEVKVKSSAIKEIRAEMEDIIQKYINKSSS